MLYHPQQKVGQPVQICELRPGTTVQTPYLIKEPLWKLLKALGTHKALLMVQLSITVHNLLCGSKARPAALTHRICQSVCHVATRKHKKGGHVRKYTCKPCIEDFCFFLLINTIPSESVLQISPTHFEVSSHIAYYTEPHT